MLHLRDGLPLNLHGAQVGVGSVVIDRLYREIFELDFQDAEFSPNPNLETARKKVDESFGSLAPAVWPEWEAKLAARTERDLERLAQHESLIKGEIERTLTIGRKVRSVLTAAGAPTAAGQLGISADELEAAIRQGRKIRNRYTALDVAAEFGILDTFAVKAAIEGGG
jgi:glycerol-1-phosphate dehydrogenase [NAD(P)+]